MKKKTAKPKAAKIAAPKPTPIKAHAWTDGGEKVLLLKRIDKATRSTRDGSFKYPPVGQIVEAPDFNDKPVCGGGIHAWPWGMGLGEGMEYDIIGDEWLVIASLPQDVVGELKAENDMPGEKCKAKSGEVVYSGPFAGAWAMVNGGRHRLIQVMAKDGSADEVTSGNSAKQASSGNYAKQASSGNYATQASSGNYATQASSGYFATQASSGDSAKQASSGNYAKQASSGNYATQASSGNYATQASSGNYATQASSGDSAKQASSGNYAKQEATGKASAACSSGSGAQIKVGESGAFALRYDATDGPRFLCGKVGENGIKSDTWYEIRNGKIEEVAP